MINENILLVRVIHLEQWTTKNGQRIGIEFSVKRINLTMASEIEVKFYIERQKRREAQPENQREHDYYMVLLNTNKNGSD